MSKNIKKDEDFELEENFEDRAPEMADISDKTKKIKIELKACQAERSEYLDGWQRAKADYLNLKKENEENKHEISKWAKEGVLTDLFTLADSFEIAFGNKEAWEQAPENWRKGIEYIYSQLQTILRDHGVEEISPKIGDKFNPSEQEPAATIEASTEEEDDEIVEVIKKGYRLHKKIVRPASVKVKHWSQN
jgi:molecular chaperone GrpE